MPIKLIFSVLAFFVFASVAHAGILAGILAGVHGQTSGVLIDTGASGWSLFQYYGSCSPTGGNPLPFNNCDNGTVALSQLYIRKTLTVISGSTISLTCTSVDAGSPNLYMYIRENGTIKATQVSANSGTLTYSPTSTVSEYVGLDCSSEDGVSSQVSITAMSVPHL